MKVALVYDRVNKWGGAERVLLELHKMFPKAPLYTSVYDPKGAPWARVFPKVVPSQINKFKFLRNKHELLPFLMPYIFESFNFNEYDLVISVTSEAAKGIITGPNTKHVCYMLTPTRYLWSGYSEYFKNPIIRFLSKPIVNWLKEWDRSASCRPDEIISISTEVKDRVRKYYNRESDVIFPPISLDTGRAVRGKNDYYLVVSRLVPYKKVDIVIEAFNRLNYPLVVVGVGSEVKKLKKLAKSRKTKFVGYVSDDKLKDYYRNCKALIFPQLEDFGLTPLEAQSFGKPVIAYNSGGVLDTVIDGKTGVYFEEQIWQSLYAAVEKFENSKFDSKIIVRNAKKFSKENFRKEFYRRTRKL